MFNDSDYRTPGHTHTCLCAQCSNFYNYHAAVHPTGGTGAFPRCTRNRKCEFCRSFEYARHRADMSERNGGQPNIMSTMNMCERCETFALGRAMGSYTFSLRPDGEYPDKRGELCPGCVAEFLDWLKGWSGLSERPKAYKEPYEEPKDDPVVSREDLIKFILGENAQKAIEGETE